MVRRTEPEQVLDAKGWSDGEVISGQHLRARALWLAGLFNRSINNRRVNLAEVRTKSLRAGASDSGRVLNKYPTK